MVHVEREFSLGILLRTLFSPWRRILTPRGRSLDAKIQAALDNFVSRCVGFVVRISVVFAALFMIACVALAGVVVVVLWPLIPIAAVYGLIRGITG